MLTRNACLFAGRVLIIFGLIGFLNTDFSNGATLYKRYMVVNHNGQEMLCEPYIVAENDSVLRLFQQKGEISHQDFPDFLNLFQHVNPSITDVNNIHPGQQILIPLKKIGPHSFPDQELGIVDIPFITITSLPDILKQHADSHKVENNEAVSRLIARHYGPYGSKSYKEGIEIFQALNPQISDLNKIYEGQKLFLPNASLKNEIYYTALFDSSGRLKQEGALDFEAYKNKKSESQTASVSTLAEDTNPYQLTASILNGHLKDNGVYFFPSKTGKDVQIDLAAHPLIEKPDGEKILFVSNNMTDDEKTAIKNFWPTVTFNPVSTDASFETIVASLFTSPETSEPLKNAISFSELAATITLKARWIFETGAKEKEGIYKNCVFMIQDASEKIPETLCQYLKEKRVVVKDILQKRSAEENLPGYFKKGSIAGEYKTISIQDKKRFINDLVIALDLYYAQNINISFPYSGIQISAFASLISTGDGKELLVDFENLYGDAFDAIKAAGFTIISIKKIDTPDAVIKKILTSLNISHKISPAFKGAEKRVSDENVYIQLKGNYYIERNNHRKYLLLLNPIPDKIARFLQGLGIDIISIQA